MSRLWLATVPVPEKVWVVGDQIFRDIQGKEYLACGIGDKSSKSRAVPDVLAYTSSYLIKLLLYLPRLTLCAAKVGILNVVLLKMLRI